MFLIGKLTNTEKIDQLISNVISKTKEGNIASLSLKKGIINEPLKANQILSLENDVNLLAHAGPMVKTLEEIIAIRDIENSKKIRNKNTRKLYERAYQREKRRLFGDIKFDYIYNHENDIAYWKSLCEVMNIKGYD